MTTEILNSINWIDILMGVVLIRALYIGLKGGLVIELFKLLGVFFAVFITLHYYSAISKFVQDKVHLPPAATDLSSFAFLWAIVILAFKFIREGFTMLFKIEAHSLFDRWGGLAMGVVRGFLLCSLLVLLLRISAIEYFVKNLEKSMSGAKLASLSPKPWTRLAVTVY